MKVFEELQARGLLAQLTDEKEIRDLVNAGGATFYIGFDPTADSLHVGHFMALCLMKRLQMAGNKPIALVGGGTGMIGDPSGRTDLRSMMSDETIAHNCDCFRKQMSRFIEFGTEDELKGAGNKALMVNNADWLRDLNYIEFIRDIGIHFSVNRMLAAECYKNRMEKGLSFLEFNYMLMQSYDFLMLYEKYGCNMQFGGDDQWSNMLGGTELIRRKLGRDAYAMTITLLLNSEGNKMGKTAKGAVWLDPDKTTPYDFYQYWRNVSDADVMKCLRMLTFLPVEEIDEMEHWDDTRINEKKEVLARELTTLVHGEEEAKKAESGARALFQGGGDDAFVPQAVLSEHDLRDGLIDIAQVLVSAGLCPSKGEARRAVEQGGVSVGDEKVTDVHTVYEPAFFRDGVLVRRGKKAFRKVFYDEQKG
ncbi:MAG: tyrosine--tRNA ligase [Lachnospiraceae bacterium]|nr:tyrosine--tRNA ligase [Lachnospiraceae bacterium]